MSLLETFFNWKVLVDAMPQLWSGLFVTLQLGLLAIVLGLVGGLLLSLVDAPQKGIADLAAALQTWPDSRNCRLEVPLGYSANLWSGRNYFLR